MIQKQHVWVFAGVMAALIAGTSGAATIDRTGEPIISYSSYFNDGECGHRVFDNTDQTKWLTASGNTTGWIAFDFSGDDAFAIDGYTITSANDAADRTPKNWTLEGSNDGLAWTTLDTQTDQTGWGFFEKRSFSFSNTTPYKIYRLNVSANNGAGNLMGFSELELLEGTIDRTDLPIEITASSELNIREAGRHVVDGTDRTKWLTASGQTTGWLRFRFKDGASYRINGYAITSANDWSERDPKDWVLEGSNNGTTWIVVDQRQDEFWTARRQRRMFEFSNFTSYEYYRLNITAIKNSSATNLMGFSELELLDIQEDPKITEMSPDNFNATSANPLVLQWDSVFNTPSASYTVYFGTDPNFVNPGSIVQPGVTEKQWTVPEASISDDAVYYWRVEIVDDPLGTGVQTFAGPVVKFRVLRQAQKVLEWTMDDFGAGTAYDYEKPIVNVTAAASSEESGSRSAARTVGQWGLRVDAAILDPNGLLHSNNASEMWICNPDQVGQVWIQFEFDDVYPVGTMHVWNHNVGEPWTAELSRGMRNVVVSYSQDESAWTTLGSYTIPMGTGVNGMPPSIGIDFNGAPAKYVRIAAAATNSNWGADRNFHALSEVRFGIHNEPVISYVIPDQTGNGNDGATYVDPQLVTESIQGTALSLTANDQVYMVHTDPNFVETLPLGANEDCYDSWTMNCYALMYKAPPHPTFVFGFGGFDTGTGRYVAGWSNIHFWGGHDIDGSTTSPFDVNRWQMLTATYDGGRLRLYKNAVKIADQAIALGVALPNVYINGPTAWGRSGMVGLVDEFTIYKGALTQAQIDQLKAAMPTQYQALNPVPVSGSTNTGIDPILKWDAPRDAINPTYDLYLGTDPANLLRVKSGLTETQFDSIELNLLYGTTYYWKIDTANGDMRVTWSFATMPESSAPVLALGWDFENTVTYTHTFEKAIENVVATASSYENPTATGRSPDRAANGIGLWVVPQIEGQDALKHANNATYTWISQPDVMDRPWIKFAFDAPYELGTMHVWNHNLGLTEELNRGMRDVIVRYSLTDSDDPNAFTVLGNYTIPMGTGENGMTPSIAIPFEGIEAQYVMIQAAETNSNWGAARNFHALSEVRFGISGTTAVSKAVEDIAGYGNVGNMFVTPEFVPGVGGGTAVQFQPDNFGISGLIDRIDARIADANVLPFGADDLWSMNLYVYLPRNPASPTLFAGFGATDTGTGRWVGRFNGVHFWGGNNIDVSSSKQYRYGHWQMLTATYSGTELKLYLNGIEVASGSPSGFLETAQRVTIGGWNPWGNYLRATIDDFTIYKGVLPRAQIVAMAEALPIDGDMDFNGTVDIHDLPLFVADWLVEYDETTPSDFTGDRKVNLDDFAVFAENWMKVQ
jgi:hypothetical protein